MHLGRISKAKLSIRLTANVIKTKLGLELTQDEQILERSFGTDHA